MAANRPVIVHFTTLHPRWDPRIRLKEASTLARELPVDVRIYVQDGKGDEDDPAGFRVVDMGPASGSRLKGMIFDGRKMVAAIRRLKPDVAHFHDPELLPWALSLRLRGIKVVYDVHEDFPSQIRHSPAFPRWLRPFLPIPAKILEWIGSRAFNAIVAATPEIGSRFPRGKTVVVQNRPLLNELHAPQRTPMEERPQNFIFIGGLSEGRGMIPMLDAISMMPEPSKLVFAGWLSNDRDRANAEAHPGWRRVVALGTLDRAGVARVLGDARAGLVLFQPLPNNIAGRPIKLTEYMSAALPVVASDYPRWREIVDGAECGLLVDPQDPGAIARAMQRILDYPEESARMGENGRQAVIELYNWESEAKSLVTLYREKLL